MNLRAGLSAWGAGALALGLSAGGALSQSGPEFYKGKTISVITSTGAGGLYDLAARSLVQHMPRHIPGAPTMVVRNMPGGGHMRATNFMFTQAPKDGLTIATVANIIPMHQVTDGKGVMYDAAKFGWLGSLGLSNLTIAVSTKAGAETMADAMTREVTLGATGVGSGSYIYPQVINRVLGARFKIVTGYQSTTEVDLAILRGEVMGRGGGSYTSFVQEHPDWLRENRIRFLVQIGIDRDANLPGVPLMSDLGRTDEEKRILAFISSPVKVGRPYLAPPGIPAERLAALRRAFNDTMADPLFVQEATRIGLDVTALSGDELQKLVAETISTPPELVAKARAAMDSPESAP
ncbi:MAG: tripartite tricarboxylate transporter family receptor [Hyphomicrobiales bacterium]|nr:tripartite tricarboxylate transporter family receptor [Hyphomicrobiales bacterium]